MPFFGFTPSEGLLNDIQTGIANKNSSEPLYPLRDKIALQLNEEIIENVLTQLVQHFPASEKRDTAEKTSWLCQINSCRAFKAITQQSAKRCG